MASLFFKHFVDSLSGNSRLKALVRRYGAQGYATYFYLMEHLYRQGGDPISEFDARQLARDLKIRPERFVEIMDYMAGDECGQLIQKSEEGYESRYVTSTIRYNKRVAKAKSAGGRKGMMKRWRDRSIVKEEQHG